MLRDQQGPPVVQVLQDLRDHQDSQVVLDKAEFRELQDQRVNPVNKDLEALWDPLVLQEAQVWMEHRVRMVNLDHQAHQARTALLVSMDRTVISERQVQLEILVLRDHLDLGVLPVSTLLLELEESRVLWVRRACLDPQGLLVSLDSEVKRELSVLWGL